MNLPRGRRFPYRPIAGRDQSRRVYARMLGNSVQDLGALGAAGMSIGELATYAAEGSITLAALRKVRPPS